MIILERFIDKLKTVRTGLEDIAIEVIEESEEDIVQLNLDQLNEGVTADGSDIQPEYTPFTVRIKKRKNQPFDRVTLKDTGDFYSKVFVKPFGNQFQISSDDPKTAMLVKKYGDKIFGLTEQNKHDLAEIILKPRFIEKLKQRLE